MAPTGGILVLGDSLSAAYGLPVAQGWVALLRDRLLDLGYTQPVIDASVSGETSAGGLSRLPALLDRHRPSVVIVELGANDGLRGLPLTKMRDHLAASVEQIQAARAKVLLLGMRLPPNYGKDYTERFHAVYRDLAATYDLPWVPFFLAEVATEPALMQADGLHPNAAAQPLLLDRVWPVLRPLLTTTAPARP